ncbi:HipA N-terminal domain-containing protein [uncultured Microscilla sp.]|uniref:HipA N-terminal domain-containing protein n=1 Tax=uncultured Microscilla sp. TaxID=432653 RepID=UPI00262A4D64|nr:HipA N-terminal domain-containing protein [uncultured Microscilla sp.]
MKKALVKIHNVEAGTLTEFTTQHYTFQYLNGYKGAPVSLTMPIQNEAYEYASFPPFFEGLLPEGIQLAGLLKTHKIDKHDYFEQLLTTGSDLVGAVTVEKIPANDA